MTLIKCCGMFRIEDIEAVNAARPDYCGFIVNFPKSHRNVTAERARELRCKLDAGIAPVGVFVDPPSPRDLAETASQCAFDAVQLHGGEDEQFIRDVRACSDIPIIKAFMVRDKADLEAARASSADYVLLDNGWGTGKPFDWELLEGFERPYFLAGGLTPGTIPEAIARLNPYAVDISSGIETDKRKDPQKIAAAVKATREAGIPV